MNHLRMSHLLLKAVIISIIMLTAFPAMAQGSENCTVIGRWADGPCRAVAVKGDMAYLGNGGNLEIFDFTDPANNHAYISLDSGVITAHVAGWTIGKGYVDIRTA